MLSRPSPVADGIRPASAVAPGATTHRLTCSPSSRQPLLKEIPSELKSTIGKEIVSDIIATLSEKYPWRKILTGGSSLAAKPASDDCYQEKNRVGHLQQKHFASLKTFKLQKEKCEVPVWTVKLGATKAEGGTRGRTYPIGGATCMPFHLWEGDMPNRPLVAMEVFDVVSEKYPAVLREAYGDLLANPAEMAKACVEKYGADLISVRLEGTHPEKGNRHREEAVELVKSMLAAVDVPLIITGHNHFDKNNEVMKAVAQACAGENLLLNWVEQNNYRTIAGAAMATATASCPQPDRREHRQAAEHPAHQHGPQARADRHRPA